VLAVILILIKPLLPVSAFAVPVFRGHYQNSIGGFAFGAVNGQNFDCLGIGLGKVCENGINRLIP
jgi:hypothetical protein